VDNTDPKGYYRILGIRLEADHEEVKAAYRRRAMELHPDRNKAADATLLFQLLTEAYQTLGDPRERTKYDALASATAKTDSTRRESQTESAKPREQPRPEPVVCSCCSQVTAQPRFTIFYEVKSFLLFTSRKTVQGVFCSICAEKKCLRATTVTWLLGWWGIPWGPIYSIHALAKNLLGGTQPARPNAWLAARQATVLAMLNQLQLAHAVALEAIRLANKIPVSGKAIRERRKLGYDTADEGNQIRENMADLLRALGQSSDHGPRLQDAWRLFRRPFYVQVIPVLAVIGAIALVSALSRESYAPFSPSGPTVNASSPASYSGPAANPTRTRSQTSSFSSVKPKYIPPLTAPNGAPWPTTASYVSGYDVRNVRGYSQLTIDNRQNDAPVFVKIFALTGSTSIPVRFVFIPGHSSFTAEQLTPGRYDVRYRDLTTGALARSEAFSLTQRPNYGGMEYSHVEMTLYKVQHGNMHTYALTEEDF
jgi:hypothetical protein